MLFDEPNDAVKSGIRARIADEWYYEFMLQSSEQKKCNKRPIEPKL